MVEAIITVLTLALLAGAFGRLHRLGRARIEAAERALVASHIDWAETHGGGRHAPELRRPWIVGAVQVRAEIDGREVLVRSGEYRVEGEGPHDEPRTACAVRLSTEQPHFSLHPRLFGFAVGRGIGPGPFDSRYLVHRPAHAGPLLTSDSRVLLLALPDRLSRPVSLDLTDDVLQLWTEGHLDSPTTIQVLVDATLALARSIEAIDLGAAPPRRRLFR